MNRVLVFGITENPGGVESVIMNYYRKIDKTKIQFDFLCNTETVAYEEEIKSLGGAIYHITSRRKNYREYKKEIKLFFEENAKKYSTIWVNVCSLANIDYLKYAKKYGIKYRIIHSHNSQNMDSKLRGMIHKLNRLNIEKYATDYWSCSEEAGEWFFNNEIINGNKYLIVNNAIDTEKYMFDENIRNRYRKKLDIDNKLVIGHVGRFHFQKNQEFLLDLFYEINKIDKNIVLLLIGQGEDENKLKNKVSELNLSDKVYFLGVRDDVPQIMQAMDFFLFPSLFEGLGLVLLEAQAAGLPVVASKDVIPQHVKMSKKFDFIPLNQDKTYWAKKIIEKLEILQDRSELSKKNISNIKKAGYDINIETQKIEEYLKRN